MLYYIELTHTGNEKIKIIQLVRALSGMGLAETKKAVENPPFTVVRGLNETDANEVCKAFALLDASAKMLKDFDSAVENPVLTHLNLYECISFSHSEEEVPSHTVSQSASASQSRGNLSSSVSHSKRNSASSKTWTTNTPPVPKTSDVAPSNNNRALAGSIVAVISIISGFTILFTIISIIQSNSNTSNHAIPTFTPNPAIASHLAVQGASQSNVDTILDEMSHQLSWRSFAQDAFGKEVTELTYADLSRVTYIDYNRIKDGDLFYFTYMLDDGVSHSIAVPEEELNLEHLQLFMNLEYLDSNYIDYERKAKLTLPNLKHLGYRETSYLYSFSDYINTDSILSLRAYSTYKIPNYTAFPSLESLELEIDRYTDLSGLQTLTNLKSLKIVSDYGDFSATDIIPLTSLETLELSGRAVKDIRFIENLPNLKCFGLYSSSVINLSPLAQYADQLTELHLYRNYSAHEYAFISDMTQLKVLELVGPLEDESEYPNLSKLINLEELTVGQTHDLSSLHELTGIKKLVLDSPYDFDYSYLSDMKQITELHLHDGSIHEEALSYITSLPNVEYLCLDDTFIWCDISNVFQMPCVRNLNLNDVDCALVLDQINTDSDIEVLNMKGLTIHHLTEDGEWDYHNNSYEDISYISDLFSKLPALKTLYIPDNRIQDLDFLTQCSQLNHLDISRSYVVDLSPLQGLPIRSVNCYDTPITNDGGFGDCIFSEY